MPATPVVRQKAIDHANGPDDQHWFEHSGGSLTDRSGFSEWVLRHARPHEHAVRAWLGRHAKADSPDDIIQDAYVRMGRLEGVDHILDPRAYFFQVARSLVFAHRRRGKILAIEQLSEATSASAASDEPSAERALLARDELRRLRALIDQLPERRRMILELRKWHGLSQKDIAQRVGVTENVVENELARALRSLTQAMADEEANP